MEEAAEVGEVSPEPLLQDPSCPRYPSLPTSAFVRSFVVVLYARTAEDRGQRGWGNKLP